MRTSQRVASEKTVMYGRRKVTRIVTEVTEEPYVLLSCGHEERAVNFDHMHRNRKTKRVNCYQCLRLAEKAERHELVKTLYSVALQVEMLPIGNITKLPGLKKA